jgi:hypothetical protein
MKIEVILCENINEVTTGMTCFEASLYVINNIRSCKSIKGMVLIDGVAVKFSFSPYFMDGDIYSKNDDHRMIVRYLIPIYVLNNKNKGQA